MHDIIITGSLVVEQPACSQDFAVYLNHLVCRMIVKQISEGWAEVENQYSRIVRPEGNVKALEAMARTMELRPFFEWRGLGFITHSALKLRSEFADWDAELRYEVPG